MHYGAFSEWPAACHGHVADSLDVVTAVGSLARKWATRRRIPLSIGHAGDVLRASSAGPSGSDEGWLLFS